MRIAKIETEEMQALVSVMDELVTSELELKGKLRAIEKEKEKIEFLMKEALEKENKDVITCGYYSFGFDIKERTAFNQASFKKEHPDLFEKFKTTQEIKRFCFGHRS